MNSLNYRKGLFVFLIAFSIGTFAYYLQINIQKSKSEFTQKQNKTESIENQKLKCEPKSNEDAVYNLYKERLELEVKLITVDKKGKDKSEFNQTKERLKKVNQTIEELEKDAKEGNFLIDEINPNQKLIHFENCIQN